MARWVSEVLLWLLVATGAFGRMYYPGIKPANGGAWATRRLASSESPVVELVLDESVRSSGSVRRSVRRMV